MMSKIIGYIFVAPIYRMIELIYGFDKLNEIHAKIINKLKNMKEWRL